MAATSSTHNPGTAMNHRFALTTVLWLSIAGTAAAARPGPPIISPDPPAPDGTELRLRSLERQVGQQQVQIQSLQTQNQALRSELVNMLAINDHVRLAWVHGRPTVRFEAVNLQVVNGAGSETGNGLGNIVIGYDGLRSANSSYYEPECSRGTKGNPYPFQFPVNSQAECLAAGGTWQLNHKGGSHYLVVGDQHNYNGWSGIVAGLGHTSNTPHASVTGGTQNQANGWGATVSGGSRNRASGYLASVTAGTDNIASGQYANVGAGSDNVASGPRTSISGGTFNDAIGPTSSVSGGTGNSAEGEKSAISGGAGNTASGAASSISGGRNLEVSDVFGWGVGED